jgi:hypothetical protein
MDPLVLAIIAQLASSGAWEHVRELMRRGDRSAAEAEVDSAISEVRTDAVSALGESAKKDARFKVLALASLDERPILSTVLGMQSAERVGENLTKATWALVVASAALVVATIVLVIITALRT